jgi:prepilin-type N-terminal cleavage/methylation domain-containing protein/prepilin-type processing-associated H-X9-DG protein
MGVRRVLQRWNERLRKRAGFTLVEVLAVTSIMTGLASNGNNFAACKDKANQTVCKNNLMQIHRALMMFLMDNESYPQAWFFPPDKHPYREQYNIANILKSYTGAPQLFICPTACQELQQRKITYLWNDQLNNKGQDSLPNPTETWVMEDINAVTNKVPPSHDTGYNVLFGDGHVKFLAGPPQLRPAG